MLPADAKFADEALPCIFPAPAELAARDQIHTRLWPRFELGSYLVLTGTVPNNSSPTWNLADPTIVGWGVSRHAGALGGLPKLGVPCIAHLDIAPGPFGIGHIKMLRLFEAKANVDLIEYICPH